MAKITNCYDGPAYLAIDIDIQRKEPELGMIARQAVLMNSDLGLLWAQVTFTVGEDHIFSHEVLLHSQDIERWAQAIENLVQGEAYIEKKTHFGYERCVDFDCTSPELIIKVTQLVFMPQPKQDLPEAEIPADLKEFLESFQKQNPPEPTQEPVEETDTPHYAYELLVILDTGIAAGADGVTGIGPAMFLGPSEEKLLRFARDLRAEARMALLLGE